MLRMIRTLVLSVLAFSGIYALIQYFGNGQVLQGAIYGAEAGLFFGAVVVWIQRSRQATAEADATPEPATPEPDPPVSQTQSGPAHQ